MSKRLFGRGAIAGIAAAASLLALPAAGYAFTCEAEIKDSLKDLSVPEEDVKSIKVSRGGGGGQSAGNVRYDAWIRLHSCDGYLMISLTRSCFVQQSYNRGDCAVPGVTHP